MRRLLPALCLLLLAAACIPPEPDDDLRRTFDPELTVMGAIQEAGVLRVGIDDSVAPGGAFAGFAEALGGEVADSLGVDVEVARASTEELLAGVEEDGTFDLVFPLLPITEQRVRHNQFTDPFLVAHQRIFETAPGAHSRVCSFADPETGANPAVLEDGVTVTTGDPASCLQALRRGDVDSLTGPDIVLADVAAELPGNITGDQLNTEGYGAVIETGASAWTDYVNAVFEEAQQEGRWTGYFERWLADALGVQDPPGMSAEEAAALFPKDVSLS